MSTIGWIVRTLQAADPEALDGEELYRRIENKVEKQAMYSLLSYHARKSLMLVRTQDPVTKFWKYQIDKTKPLPNNVQDELLRIDQELAEQSGARTVSVAPAQAAPKPIVAAVRDGDILQQRKEPLLADEFRLRDAKPAPAPFSPGNPYDLVIEAMKKKRAALVEETAKLDVAIEAVQDVRHSA